jgi:hypothetical protein
VSSYHFFSINKYLLIERLHKLESLLINGLIVVNEVEPY